MRDWYDDYILEGDMNIYVISDTHLKHDKMETYCQRPSDFTERIHKNVMNTVKDGDLLLHLGDVGIGKYVDWEWMVQAWPGTKGVIRGNHDRSHSVTWWMQHGFHFACDYFVLRNVLFTHEPANAVIKSDGHRPYGALEAGLPFGCEVNIHGHLHNIWDGFHSPERLERDKALLGVDPTKQLKHKWQRLFAVEYTDYRPVELNKFLSHPEKYQATGPRRVIE
jgi:calcineurin-like phosphoesterase family protein